MGPNPKPVSQDTVAELNGKMRERALSSCLIHSSTIYPLHVCLQYAGGDTGTGRCRCQTLASSGLVTAVRLICKQPSACGGGGRSCWRETGPSAGRAGRERWFPLWSHEGPLEKRRHCSQAFTSHVDLSQWGLVGRCPSVRDSANNVSETSLAHKVCAGHVQSCLKNTGWGLLGKALNSKLSFCFTQSGVDEGF